MARVLVVDDDPWTQRMVSAVLSHRGHVVDLASDGWEGLIRVGRARPDLVVTEVKLPTTDGWAFATSVRERAESKDVPFVFLVSLRSGRMPGSSFREALDQIMDKPFRLEQLEVTVQEALDRRPGSVPGSSGESAAAVPAVSGGSGGGGGDGGEAPPVPRHHSGSFRIGGAGLDSEMSRRGVLVGALEHFALSSVLIVLELERKSGTVILRGPDAVGRISLRNGRVVRATIEGSGGTRRGALAVYELLTWARGRFEFNAGEVSGDDEIGSSTSFLLLEGARFQDERNHDHDKENN